jgi:flagellar motility protein MotE (MotC chaperone)
MMKILCLLLSLGLALTSGVLMYTIKSGRLPMAAPVEEGVEELDPEAVDVAVKRGQDPLDTSQIGLIDELIESLQASQKELGDSKLRLDKREKDLQELYTSYLKMRQVVEELSNDLETRLIQVDEKQKQNFKVLAGVYAQMRPESSARALKYMEPERVALILTQMDARAMAAVMDAAISTSNEASETVAAWSDAIRRLSASENE